MQFSLDKCEMLRITQKWKPLITQYLGHACEIMLTTLTMCTMDFKLTVFKLYTFKLAFSTVLTGTRYQYASESMIIKMRAYSELIGLNTELCLRKTKANAYQSLVRPLVSRIWLNSVVSTHTEKQLTSPKSRVSSASQVAGSCPTGIVQAV